MSTAGTTPACPTIVGLRRRGFTPKSLQNFAERCGVSKVSGGWIDYFRAGTVPARGS